jgi:sulfide dehydrogenase cytochrome subunit
MVPSRRTHLLRLIVVLVVGIGGLLFIKGLFVPAGWDRAHWYRTGALQVLKQRPLIYAGNNACRGCHGKTRKDHEAVVDALAAGVHEHLACESCHGPLHEADHTVAAAKIARDSSLCLRCHEQVAARPRKIGLFNVAFMAHQAKGVTRESNCMQCHDPHAPRPKLIRATQTFSLPVELQDIVAGCDGCHQPGTRMPFIAGQPETYLRAVMTEYRTGARHTEAMKGLFRNYDDSRIAVLAGYYATLPWSSAGEATDAKLVEAGAAIHARRCAACHGADGSKGEGLTPRLSGQPVRYIESRLLTYLDPKAPLPNEVMRTVVKGLSAADARALAHFYASEPSAPRGVMTDLTTIAAGCESCHRSSSPNMPRIDGQPHEYLATVMQQFRDGTRSSVVMADLLRAYSDEKIAALARLFAAAKWSSVKVRTEAALVKKGGELHQAKCAICHGQGGSKAEGMTPRLAGQNPFYLEAQLLGAKETRNKVPNKMMREVARDLAAEDIRALSQYYASGTGVKEQAEAAAPMNLVDVSGIVGSCEVCHSASDPSDAPLIAGQMEKYLRTVMQQFSDGTREGKVMGKTMKKYDADQIASLAQHYAKLKWTSAKTETKPELVARGKALHDTRCATCHANGGRKSESDMPRLAGQPVEFIENEIRRYQDPAVKLPNQFMRSVVKSLSAEEASALAHYYASQND